MAPTLLQQGLTLMLVGMGTVFVFLTALVVSMNVMASVVRRFDRPEVEEAISEEEVAAITAAIALHRGARR